LISPDRARILDASDTFEAFWGVRSDAVGSEELLALVEPGDRARVRALRHGPMADGRAHEYGLCAVEGKARTVRERAFALPDGGVACFVELRGGSAEAPSYLEHTQAFLTQILDAVPDPIFVKDEAHRWLIQNQASCTIMGRPREAILGKTVKDFFPPEEAQVFWEKDEIVFRTGAIVTNEEAFTDSSGTTHWISTKKAPFTAPDGRKMLVGTIRDISDQKRWAEEIRRRDELFRQVIDLVPHAIFAKDRQGRILLANQALAHGFGVRVDQIQGQRDDDFFTPEQVLAFREEDLEVLDSGRPKLIPERPVTLRTGERRILQTTKIPFIAASSAEPAVLAVSVDVTPLKQAEEDLRRANHELTRALATLERTQAELSAHERAERERLAKELEIASRIQTGILPRTLEAAGLEIAAQMVTASEAGGDYYDVLPCDGGAWIGIGDVAGHGLNAGLVMMMIQSVVSALTSHDAGLAPRELIRVVNEVLFENVRRRLRTDDHATLSLLRYHTDGRVVFAGAHEEILVRRAHGSWERVSTPGPWVGGTRDVTRSTPDSELWLHPGDLVVLHTDGVTEARSDAGEYFGVDRLCAAIDRVRAAPAGSIVEQVMKAVEGWTAHRQDDMTVLVARYHGVGEQR
jgi:PAS domain S-box-containing protein